MGISHKGKAESERTGETMRCEICYGESNHTNSTDFKATEDLVEHIKAKHPLFTSVAIFQMYKEIGVSE